MPDEILERKSFSAGKIILKEHDQNNECAYIIQSGEVMSFITEKNKVIEVGRYGPGCIIAETNLMINNPLSLNYQAATDTTMIVILRHDFEKKLTRLDQTIQKVIKSLTQKIKDLEKINAEQALSESRVDDKALEIVEHLLRDMDPQRKNKYEEVLLPHFNVMCKALEEIRKEERHAKQKQVLNEKVNELKEKD